MHEHVGHFRQRLKTLAQRRSPKYTRRVVAVRYPIDGAQNGLPRVAEEYFDGVAIGPEHCRRRDPNVEEAPIPICPLQVELKTSRLRLLICTES
ncbi:hypothetical protein [Ralstonia insidiosa]|uniref:hypothetical protein n=1 Tax=Ralstonia insidiosa TaxID=190721 RepID=UPI00128B1F6F|nr:hypothetical protein [Ralstonia insidiosa]